ncbi:MAG: hypothetical protein ABI459_10120, partial [Deltaproteobacteria bacterium]
MRNLFKSIAIVLAIVIGGLAVLTLFASETGRIILFFALLFVVIILYRYLLAILLYGLVIWLLARLLRRTKLSPRLRTFAAFGLAVLLGFVVAQSANFSVDRRIGPLTASDHVGKPTLPPKVLAIWQADEALNSDACADLCAAILTQTQVQRVLVLTGAPPPEPPSATTDVISYRLEAQMSCPSPDRVSGIRPNEPVAPTFLGVNPGDLERAAGLGLCIVREAVPFGQADALWMRWPIAGFDFAPSYLANTRRPSQSAMREVYSRMDGGTETEVYRITSVIWQRHPLIALPQMGRFEKRQARLGQSIDSLLSAAFFIRLGIPTQPVLQRSLDDLRQRVALIVKQTGPLTTGEAVVVAQFASDLYAGRYAAPIGERDAALVVASALDLRTPLSTASPFIIAQAQDLPADTTAALADLTLRRLELLWPLTQPPRPNSVLWSYAAFDQIEAAALLLAVLPRDSLAPQRARIETLAKDASNQFPV